MLILQCDVTAIDARCIKLAKFIIGQFRNEYITMKDPNEQTVKHACIILHIHRDKESIPTSSDFIYGWKLITIESLSQQELALHALLDNSLYDIINSECFVNSNTTFEKLFKDELLWCFSCIKYPFSNEHCNSYVRYDNLFFILLVYKL
jgi:hypothetical protein